MKQVRAHATFFVLIVYLTIALLIFAPVLCDISLAQSADSSPPVLSHRPMPVSFRGETLSISAVIGDASSIREATLTIIQNGKSVTGNFPERSGVPGTPVLVSAKRDLQLYTNPDTGSPVKAMVAAGERLVVQQISGNYYRVQTPAKHTGFAEIKDTGVVIFGKHYGVSLPANMTAGTKISYQIKATDIYGNTAASDLLDVSLMTRAEIAELLAQRGVNVQPGAPATATPQAGPTVSTRAQQGERSKPFYARLGFWLLVGLTGGVLYYYLSQQKDKENTATIDVLIDWN